MPLPGRAEGPLADRRPAPGGPRAVGKGGREGDQKHKRGGRTAPLGSNPTKRPRREMQALAGA
jgi:hypothetical protein